MKNAVSTQDNELKQAVTALNWIVYLAEMEFSGQCGGWVQMGNARLTGTEAMAVMTGEADSLSIQDKRRELREKGVQPISDEFKSRDDVPVKHNLPGTFLNDDLRARFQYELQIKADAFSKNMYHADDDIPLSEKDQKRYDAAERVVWVNEARKLYKDGALYIKNDKGAILPAREQGLPLLNEQNDILDDGVIDNTMHSCDGKFYDENGDDVYTTHKFVSRDSLFFDRGTPTLDDIRDAALVTAVNDYMNTVADQAPILTLNLTAEASPLLHGLEAPQTDYDAKREFWRSKFSTLYDSLDEDAKDQADEREIVNGDMMTIFTENDLNKAARAKGLENDMNSYQQRMDDFITSAKDKIAGNAVLQGQAAQAQRNLKA